MKAKSTIKKQIARLKSISESADYCQAMKYEAYEAYHALRWVVEDTSWTPAGIFEGRKKREKGDG